ncbi:hypothetical protein BJ912DRAFT_950176 [Pholiota molesta]|nr:hypothetical protein BJ912DRAFT_950176 [Pholiota molesta]
MAVDVICAYSISGGYGTIPRMMYYVLLIVPLIFHTSEWLVDATLGASMIFSSITAVHAMALASTAGRGTVDLDIIPAYSITGIAMLLGVPHLLWSRMLRDAGRALRIVAISWIAVMCVGILASLASVRLLSSSIGQCDSDPRISAQPAGCTITCEITLPMRRTQQAALIPFPAYNSLLKCWPIPFSFIAAILTLVGLAHAAIRMHPMDFTETSVHIPRIRRFFRRNGIQRMLPYTMCAPPMSAALSIAHVVLLEKIILGKPGLPIGEDVTAIGQWGPLVGSAFALVVSIIQWTFSNEDARNERKASRADTMETLTAPGYQGEKDGTSSKYSSEPSLQTISSQHGAGRFNPDAYFEEGSWWGTGANGLVMNHRGTTWTVIEGYLRRTNGQLGSDSVNEFSLRTPTRTTTVLPSDNIGSARH